MDLQQYWLNNTGQSIHKWVNYFPIYEKHFAPWKGKSATVLEIGVEHGGSLQMWRDYFGPGSTIVGIDIDPNCARHEPPGTHVRIGDQTDTAFLQQVTDEFGPFDIVIDDGSHISDHITATFNFLYSKVTENGCYFVEDLHKTYEAPHGNSLSNPMSFINQVKAITDSLIADHVWHSNFTIKPTSFTRDTFCISFYDSIIVFDKKQIPVNQAFRIPDAPLPP
jgi:cephalosporin hydroxylase